MGRPSSDVGRSAIHFKELRKGLRRLVDAVLAHLVWVLLLAAVPLLAIGFVFASGFGSNLLAEAVGVLLGSLLTLTLIELFEQRRQRRRWAAVETALYHATLNSLCDIAIQFYLLALRNRQENGTPTKTPTAVSPFSISAAPFVAEGRSIPSGDGVATLDALYTELWKLKGIATGEREYGSMKPYFEELRTLNLRILELAQDAGLVNSLMAVEDRERVWAAQIRAGEELGWYPPDLLPALAVCRAIRSTYAYLQASWPGSDRGREATDPQGKGP